MIPLTRRSFLALTSCVSASLLSPCNAWSLSEAVSSLAHDPRRPQFHLLPARNWMNDPNGPIYLNGTYHLFFQYNPESANWGNMSWAHAVSTDMIHWRHMPMAFTMTPGGPDASGCFSGSTIAVNEHGTARVYAIYTGVIRDKKHETIRNEGLLESQCLAWSDDPMLRNWHKLETPVIPAPPPGLAITGFRDPSVWKSDDHYLLTVGSGIEKQGGCVLLYRSSDLRTWEYLHPLASGAWNGLPTSNPCDDGEMWECPDFFALDGGHVLIYSTLGKVFWQSGRFDPETLRFEAKRTGLLDLDAFYAPKTQLDAQGQRILWGWLPERRSKEEMLQAGWSGMMSLPRHLHLDSDGQLHITFSKETRSLRLKPIAPKHSLSAGTGKNSSVTLRKAKGEFFVEASGQQGFHLTVTAGDARIVDIGFSAEHRTLSVGKEVVPLGDHDTPTLHAFVDGSVIEVLLAERVGFTKRFYYTGDDAPDIHVELIGEHAVVHAWTVAPISAHRLT